MKKLKKALPLAALAVAPLAYRKLARTLADKQEVAALWQELPDTRRPANDFYLRAADFAQAMETTVVPYLKARETVSSLHTTHRISYAVYRADEPKAALIIVHGYAETRDRYAEAVYYFLNMGYDVYLPEHFGHGDSDAGVEDPDIVWVDDYATYTRDLYWFIQQIVKPGAKGLPVIGFGHSMGGAILGLTLEQHPGLLAAAIFSSPMFQVPLFRVEPAVYPLTEVLSKSGLSKAYLPGTTRFENLKLGEFKPEKVAMHSLERGRYFHARRVERATAPRWALSWGWLNASIKATHAVVRPDQIRKLELPLLMFQSAQDWFVDNRGMDHFVRHAPRLKAYRVPRSYHEIYSETDDILVPYFNTIQAFIEEVLTQPSAQTADHQAAQPPNEQAR